jgi:NTE family protein
MRSEAETRPMPLNRLFPLSSYINMLIRTFMTTISREFVDARYWPRTVVIDTGPCSLLEFKLDRAQKSDLYRRGFQTTCEILPLKFEIERVSGGTR